MSRQDTLNRLRNKTDWSVLVIGGGVNGIGTFRELALQGVDVLLVEKNDFCSGSSAASSHMLHGGLRYLENGEFRLVKEALLERNRMLRNAPHYSRPLPTTIPIFTRFSGLLNAPMKFFGMLTKSKERGSLIIKAGLTMYDAFTAGQSPMPKHQFHSMKEALRKRPKLNPNIVATATYYDAWMPYPERICMEIIMDAETNNDKAMALNYVSADDAQADTVILKDELTGETFEVKPKIVVNAGGPWIDFVNRAMEVETKFIGGTKGSHLVVDHPELHMMLDGHEIFFENDDGRIVLFFPLLDRVLMGTTDIKVDDPDVARTSEDEIEYILGMVRKVFPGLSLDRSHVVYSFVGVRPLPASDASTPGQISRDHSIKVVEPGDDLSFPILSLVGGKWTSWRAFSEHTGDAVLERLNVPRKVGTQNRAFGGGVNYPETSIDTQRWMRDFQREYDLTEQHSRLLFNRYGTRAREVAVYTQRNDDAPLVNMPDWTRREVQFIVENEKVVHLEDFLLRRSLLAMLGKVNAALLDEVARIVGEVLGWTEAERMAEIVRTADLLIDKHNVEPTVLGREPALEPEEAVEPEPKTETAGADLEPSATEA